MNMLSTHGWCALLLAMLFAAAGARAGQYRIRTTAPMALSLPAAHAGGDHFVRSDGETWQPASTSAENGILTFHIRPQNLGPDGEIDLLTDKPDWMVLEDHEPPQITHIHVDGKPVEAPENRLALGVVTAGTVSIELACTDNANPLDAQGIRISFPDQEGVAAQMDHSGLTGLRKAGTVGVTLQLREPGSYHGRIHIPDRSADAHAAVLELSCTVIGIDVAEDRQQIRLATPGGTFEFQPDRSNQLLLPVGVWAKLTSNIDGTWLYPRAFTDVSSIAHHEESQSITVTASTQGIKGKPVDGLGRLEYTFTVRKDVPGLIVETRSISLTDDPTDTSANWGWLPGDHYVTSEGKQAWEGKATDSYKTIGHVGWLWLAPRKTAARGIAWVSPHRFGESRFDTMLLYGDDKTCKQGESVTIRFAIAAADSADEARALAEMLAAKGLLTDKQQ